MLWLTNVKDNTVKNVKQITQDVLSLFQVSTQPQSPQFLGQNQLPPLWRSLAKVQGRIDVMV